MNLFHFIYCYVIYVNKTPTQIEQNKVSNKFATYLQHFDQVSPFSLKQCKDYQPRWKSRVEGGTSIYVSLECLL